MYLHPAHPFPVFLVSWAPGYTSLELMRIFQVWKKAFQDHSRGSTSRLLNVEHMQIPSVTLGTAVTGMANQITATKISSDRCTDQWHRHVKDMHGDIGTYKSSPDPDLTVFWSESHGMATVPVHSFKISTTEACYKHWVWHCTLDQIQMLINKVKSN